MVHLLTDGMPPEQSSTLGGAAQSIVAETVPSAAGPSAESVHGFAVSPESVAAPDAAPKPAPQVALEEQVKAAKIEAAKSYEALPNKEVFNKWKVLDKDDRKTALKIVEGKESSKAHVLTPHSEKLKAFLTELEKHPTAEHAQGFLAATAAHVKHEELYESLTKKHKLLHHVNAATESTVEHATKAGNWTKRMMTTHPVAAPVAVGGVTALMYALWPNQTQQVRQADGSTTTEEKMGMGKVTAVTLGTAATAAAATQKLWLERAAKAVSHVRA